MVVKRTNYDCFRGKNDWSILILLHRRMQQCTVDIFQQVGLLHNNNMRSFLVLQRRQYDCFHLRFLEVYSVESRADCLATDLLKYLVVGYVMGFSKSKNV